MCEKLALAPAEIMGKAPQLRQFKSQSYNSVAKEEHETLLLLHARRSGE
jgi:hypothetical protein